MKIKRFVGGNLAANGYVIYQRDGGACYIIDPGYSPKKFIRYIGEHQLAASGILLTHLHYDHTDGAEAVSQALDLSLIHIYDRVDRVCNFLVILYQFGKTLYA